MKNKPKIRAIRGRRDAYLTRLKKVISGDTGLADELQKTSELTGVTLQRVVSQCLREGLALLVQDDEAYGAMIKLNRRIGKVVHERDLRTDSKESTRGEVIENYEPATGASSLGHNDVDEQSGRTAEATEDTRMDSGVVQPSATEEHSQSGTKRAELAPLFETSAPGQPPEEISDLPI